MGMETIRDYEAMVYILEHNRKSAGTGENISWKKISYKKLSEEMKSYPARMKRMLGKLVLNGKVVNLFNEISEQRPTDTAEIAQDYDFLLQDMLRDRMMVIPLIYSSKGCQIIQILCCRNRKKRRKRCFMNFINGVHIIQKITI